MTNEQINQKIVIISVKVKRQKKPVILRGGGESRRKQVPDCPAEPDNDKGYRSVNEMVLEITKNRLGVFINFIF